MTNGRLIEHAKVDWEAHAPRSVFFDDIYFSGGGAEEAEHVFLRGNNLAERLAASSRFTVGELGFGSGLNFHSLVALWRRVRRPGAQLRFLSVEKFPLHPDDLRRAGAAWPQFKDTVEAVAAAFPPPVAGFHELRFPDGVLMTLGLGEAEDLLGACEASVDAWFLDGFSPAKNPGMWSERALAAVARLSAPGATLATFTVAGAVRRRLEAAGFSVEKTAGFGRKREMLRARIESPPRRSERAPWFSSARGRPLSPGDVVAVIGGGVAGASVADAAAGAGLAPVLIDPAGLAAGASGNPGGLIMPRLDLGDAPTGRFFIAAYVHALRTIGRLQADGGDAFFDRCGVFTPSLSEDDRQWEAKALAAGILPPDFIESRDGGLFFPQAGVVQPKAYVRALARRARLVNARAVGLHIAESGVRIRLDAGGDIAAEAAVIANGADALRFAEARTLPLSRIAGQIDLFKDAPAPPLATAFGPYHAPAPGGGVIVGATYDRLADDAEPATSISATRSTIDAIAAAFPDLARALSAERSVSRASARCQTPDRLPIAGPAPDVHFYGAEYDDLRLGKARDYREGRIAPNVFLLTGLGSRGLVTAPLCAAMIAAEMTGAPSPVERAIAEALHPARFFIRDLRRAARRRTK